jgi:dephospho-CoA kinase
MTPTRNWEKPIRRLEQLMRLKSFPIGLKLLEDKADLDRIPFLRRRDHPSTLCQLLNLARNFDWTVGADAGDLMGATCASVVGLAEVPETMSNGTFRSIVWTRNRAEGRKYERSIPRIPTGKFEAIALAPLVYNPFEPDMVLVYANPAQMMLLINALQFEDYEVMTFYCVGETSCSDAIARCYLTRKPSLTIPCYGERRYGHAQDDELVMALPPELMDKALRGMEMLYRRGIRYPISYAGAESDVSRAFPGAYGGREYAEKLRGNDHRLLLGVTGGIGSGKTTVARMLEELGAPIIDFDVLSRIVVEPDKPAWRDIVAYFGEQVLKEDRTLDREKMRDIVYRDMEKRKKLESFIHPRLDAEFARMVEQYAGQDPNIIIQAVIPLLIEANWHPIFHHLLMVYVPEEVQVKRLMERDGISEELARSILRAQLSIEEKKGYCDLVIDNSGTVEETRQKVAELWETLKDLQRRREQEA